MSPRQRTQAVAALACGLALAASGAAGAAPTLHFKAEPIPIAGFPNTGYILGAGTALDAEYQISGGEYGGFPPPLIGVNVYFPAGAQVHPKGFPTCAKTVLEHSGPRACPKDSAAGPVGHARGIVSFGDERVEESTTVESFYAPDGGIEFFTSGHSPVSLEILSSGHYVDLHGAGGYGLELMTEIPLVATVPGADYASVEYVNVAAGSAYGAHGTPHYYATVPRSCPPGGFAVKTEAIFDEGGAVPEVPEPVTVSYRAPCPRK